MWSNAVKLLFFPKNYKILFSGWRLRPQTPVSGTFELHEFAQRISQFIHFLFLTFGLSHLPLAKSRLSAKHRPRLLIFHSTISLSHKSSSFEKFWWSHYMQFVVRALQSKILATPTHSVLFAAFYMYSFQAGACSGARILRSHDKKSQITKLYRANQQVCIR